MSNSDILRLLLVVLSWAAAASDVTFASATAPPPPRSRAKVEAVLAKAPPARPQSELRPLRIVLVADEKDHGLNEHDYPLWQKRWMVLLGGKPDSDGETQVNLYGPPAPGDRNVLLSGAPKVMVTSAWKWPSHEQLQTADLIVMYCYRSGGGHWLWDEQSPKDLDAYLSRGGGFVVIHAATYMHVDMALPECKSLLDLTGLAYGRGNRTRREPMEIQLAADHAICRGLPQVIHLVDEPFWPAFGDQRSVDLLGTSQETVARQSTELKPQPMFWTYRRGKGRVFGCTPGHYTWTFDDPFFRLILLRGMAWAAGEQPYRFDGLALRGVSFSDSTADGRQDTRNWNQFRGPNGQGVTQADRIPIRFGPDSNVLWKTVIPPGHSSAVIWANRIFLTAGEPANEKELITLAVDREDGTILWRRVVQAETQPRLHPLNNPASSTPAADDKHVYVYFGTYGLLCYDHAGNEIWQRKLDTPASKYGTATSPILHEDKVILVLDGDGGSSRLLAVRRDTGQTVWEQPRSLFRAGWSTPMIWRHGEAEELVVLGSKRLTSYNPSTGEEIWWAGGFPEETVGIPVAGDGLLFAGAAALGGRGDEKLDAAATWKITVEEFDRNRDNQIQRDEMTEGFAFIQRPELSKDNPGYGLPVKDMDVLLRIFDRDRNRIISEAEWMQTMSGFAAMSQPNLAAIRPGATADASQSHVAWEIHRGIPETPSLLYCRGKLYLLRDGGLLTCLDASTGRQLFRERIGASGQYIASPIAAGDKLVVASVPGVVTVIQVDDELNVLARNDFAEEIFATPAVVENTIYLRTTGHLYALRD